MWRHKKDNGMRWGLCSHRSRNAQNYQQLPESRGEAWKAFSLGSPGHRLDFGLQGGLISTVSSYLTCAKLVHAEGRGLLRSSHTTSLPVFPEQYKALPQSPALGETRGSGGYKPQPGSGRAGTWICLSGISPHRHPRHSGALLSPSVMLTPQASAGSVATQAANVAWCPEDIGDVTTSRDRSPSFPTAPWEADVPGNALPTPQHSPPQCCADPAHTCAPFPRSPVPLGPGS